MYTGVYREGRRQDREKRSVPYQHLETAGTPGTSLSSPKAVKQCPLGRNCGVFQRFPLSAPGCSHLLLLQRFALGSSAGSGSQRASTQSGRWCPGRGDRSPPATLVLWHPLHRTAQHGHLPLEPLPFPCAAVLPGQLQQGAADPHRSALSGDHFPGAGLARFTVSEHSLLFPLSPSSDGNEMSVIVTPRAGGKLLLTETLINFFAFLGISSVQRKVTMGFQLGK